MGQKVAVRKIVRIDEDKCNGCGLCVPSCAEGAIRIVDGKARLAAENLCDGLGNCLGECPQGAITIEERPAEAFDERAVHEHLSAGEGRAEPACPGARPVLRQAAPARAQPQPAPVAHAGCPGAMARMLRRPASTAAQAKGAGTAQASASMAPAPRPSQLTQWPVQLALVPVSGPFWQDADVLIAADCVSFACPDFHEKLLAGKKLAIACPKLDDMEPYVKKLAEIFSGNSIHSITVAHMEVPCCGGIVWAVRTALDRAGRADIPLRDVTVTIEGEVVG